MRNYTDVRTDGGFEHKYMNRYISLNKLTNNSIVDALCSVGSQYSDTDVMIHYLVLADGTLLDMQGEHDEVYLDAYGKDFVSVDELQNIYDTDPDNE